MVHSLYFEIILFNKKQIVNMESKNLVYPRLDAVTYDPHIRTLWQFDPKTFWFCDIRPQKQTECLIFSFGSEDVHRAKKTNLYVWTYRKGIISFSPLLFLFLFFIIIVF